MADDGRVQDILATELRRGTLVLGVLSALGKRQYGYSLAQHMAENGMEVEQSTLYPLLRRLEKQGLLDSDWELEGSRPRRYYVLSELGREIYDELIKQWDETVRVTNRMLGR